MRKLLAFITLTILLPAVAHARLGETEDQCVARYGAVFARTTADEFGMALPMLVFLKNGYKLGVVLLDGKAGLTLISKSDDTDFSDNEVELLLTADSAGQKWAKQSVISVKEVWLRDDGAKAQHDPLAKSLTLYSKDFEIAVDNSQKDAEAKKTAGF
jgi:hypothetical protein